LNYDWTKNFEIIKDDLISMGMEKTANFFTQNAYFHNNQWNDHMSIDPPLDAYVIFSDIKDEHKDRILKLLNKNPSSRNPNLNLSIDEYLQYKDEYNLDVYDIIRSEKCFLKDLDKHKIEYCYDEAIYNPNITLDFYKQNIDNFKNKQRPDGCFNDILFCEMIEFVKDKVDECAAMISEEISSCTSDDINPSKGFRFFIINKSQILLTDYCKKNIFTQRPWSNCFIDPNVLFNNIFYFTDYRQILQNSLNRDKEYIRVANMILKRLIKL
jgi:hypothetical protein